MTLLIQVAERYLSRLLRLILRRWCLSKQAETEREREREIWFLHPKFEQQWMKVLGPLYYFLVLNYLVLSPGFYFNKILNEQTILRFWYSKKKKKNSMMSHLLYNNRIQFVSFLFFSSVFFLVFPSVPFCTFSHYCSSFLICHALLVGFL